MKGQVRLSEELINNAKIFAKVEGREPNQQIEFWAKIGKMAISFPDTPFSTLQGMLVGIAESEAGEHSELDLKEIYDPVEDEAI